MKESDKRKLERDKQKKIRKGELPPPPHVMPKHRRNKWRWSFNPNSKW